MKFLKTFEVQIDSDSIKALERFYDSYNNHKNRYYKEDISYAKNFKVPEFLYDEFALMKYYYDSRSGQYTMFTSNTDKANNYIKRELKKTVTKSIHKKLEDDIDNYFALKEMFDNRPRFFDGGSFDYISIGSIKNIFLIFQTALKNSSFTKNIKNYNL
jgi:hypothetical protein